MRAPKFFTRPSRILTVILFFAAMFVCTVPCTPVPIYLALAGTVVQLFSSDTGVFIVIDKRGKNQSAYLRTTLRGENRERPPEQEVGVELYPALTWQKINEMCGGPKQIPQSELNQLNVGIVRRN